MALILSLLLATAAYTAETKNTSPEAELNSAREAVRADYLNPATHIRLSTALFKAGRHVDSFHMLFSVSRVFAQEEAGKAFAESFPKESAEEAALRKQVQENPKEAEANIRKFVAAHPENTDAFVNAAFFLWQNGRVAEVRTMVQEALAKNPEQLGPLTIKGALLIEDKKVDEAISTLKTVAARDPLNRYAFEKLTSLLLSEKRDPEAALPYMIGLYRVEPGYNDGRRIEERILKVLSDQEQNAAQAATTPEKIKEMLRSENSSLRATASEIAGRTKDPGLIEALIPILDDDLPNVSHFADAALFHIGKANGPAIAKVKEKLLKSPKPFVRGHAFNLFADLLPQKEILPALIAGLQDPNAYVRFQAAGSIDHYFSDSPEGKAALAAFQSTEKDARLVQQVKRRKEHEQNAKQQAEINRQLMESGPPGNSDFANLMKGDKARDLVMQGAMLLQAQQFAKAGEKFKASLAKNEQDKTLDKGLLAGAYSGLGDAMLFTDKFAESAAAFEKAVPEMEGPMRVHSAFNLACAYSMLGRQPDAAKTLRMAFAAAKEIPGALNKFVGDMKTDAQLAKFRSSPEYQVILKEFGP